MDNQEKPKWYKTEYKWWILNFILVLGTLFYVIIGDCNQNYLIEEQNNKIELQNHKVDSLNYKLGALQYKPIIEFSRKPWVKSVRILFDSSSHLIPPVLRGSNNTFIYNSKFISLDSVKKLLKYHSLKKDSIGNVIINSYNLETKFLIKNGGNSKAEILMYAVIDSFTDKPVLRDQLLDIIEGKDSSYSSNFFPPMFNNELQPNDETLIDHKFNMIHLREKTIFHYLIIYKNENENIYDTYYLATFENIPLIWKPYYLLNNQTKKFTLVLKDITKDKFKCSKTKPSFYIYSKSQAALIDSFLVKLSEKDLLDTTKIK